MNETRNEQVARTTEFELCTLDGVHLLFFCPPSFLLRLHESRVAVVGISAMIMLGLDQDRMGKGWVPGVSFFYDSTIRLTDSTTKTMTKSALWNLAPLG